MNKSLLAAILSIFIPGLGQLYKGQLIWAIIWFLLVSSVYAVSGILLFIPSILLHALCVIHAFCGQDNNTQQGQ